jgi:hypothetical protein
VQTSSQLLLDFLQLGTHPVSASFPFQLESAALGAPTDVGKSEKIECLRFAEASFGPTVNCMTTKLDQASLFRM